MMLQRARSRIVTAIRQAQGGELSRTEPQLATDADIWLDARRLIG